MKFYGREQETAVLRRNQDAVRNGASRFVVVTGRRRVGKTRLILESLPAADMPLIYAFIYQSTSESRNLELFCKAVAEGLKLDAVPRLESFEDAFLFLFKKSQTQPITLVLDEFQNFQTVNPEIFETLQKLWDTQHNASRLLLVVSGSVTSAMRGIFENARAPLYSRQNALIYVAPFSPGLLKQILEDFAPAHSGEDLLALYALTGGIAQYIETMLSEHVFTAADMIKHLLESSNRTLTEATAALFAEFKGSSSTYFDILRQIAAGVNERSQLQSRFQENISGYLDRLENVYRLLERVEPLGETGSKRRRIRFEIADELINFWFTFLEPYQNYLEAGLTDRICSHTLQQFPQWSGRCLERFYRRHFLTTGMFTAAAPWWDRKGENEIDLIGVDALEKKIVFVEIKRNPEKFSVFELQMKSAAFLKLNPKYAAYQHVYVGLSLQELSAGEDLPFSRSQPG